ncbi:MAG TPA: family 16 glycoside hydrolase [Tepidisphaeraceae bacterium]|nr:family 16 glycoside hydrolase [Tepidisphaeraceae bacterium]
MPKTRRRVLLGVAALLAGVIALPVVRPAQAADEPPPAGWPGDSSAQNQLTDAEKAAGVKLLFDGKSLAGWNNFKKKDVRPGWQVKDGNLVCVNPKNAGDLCTAEPYANYELTLDYNITKGGNSGIIFNVTEEGGAVWQTGPEFQLQDNANWKDAQLCGWLYGLYKPEADPKTGKPLDATKPFGEWNTVRLVVSKEKCEHYINGVKYFEYQIGSEDFNKRVAESKFGKMPKFAKSDKGLIALQGDHGSIAFRNIKLRPLAK